MLSLLPGTHPVKEIACDKIRGGHPLGGPGVFGRARGLGVNAARAGWRARCLPACWRARGDERAHLSRPTGNINPVANRKLDGCVHRIVKAATIECIRSDSGGACVGCWPAHRLDRHGYIDMGTYSTEQQQSGWANQPGPAPRALQPATPTQLQYHSQEQSTSHNRSPGEQHVPAGMLGDSCCIRINRHYYDIKQYIVLYT